MAETQTPTYVDSPFNLRQIIAAAYRSSFNNRFQTAARDVKHRARVESVLIYRLKYRNNIPEREKVHTYRIRVVSINPDGKVSHYPVVINLNSINLDSAVKVRCGSFSRYTDKASMEEKGLCPDFYFRGMQVASDLGYLFGRNTTNRKQPKVTNPNKEIHLCKHIVGTIRALVESNFVRKSSTPEEDKRFMNLFK